MAIGLSESSCPIINAQRAVRVVENVTDYRKMFGPAAADGAAIANPFAITNFSTTFGKEVHNSTGRILWNGGGASRLDIWGLMTDASAAITAQLWGFGVAPNDSNIRADRLTFPIGGPNEYPGGLALGLAYPLTRNLATPSDTITLTAGTVYKQKASFVNVCEPNPDQTDGTEYYTTGKEIFSTLGLIGFMVYVTVVSAGTGIILGRLY